MFGLPSEASSILRRQNQHQSKLGELDHPTHNICAASATPIASLSCHVATLKFDLLHISDIIGADQTAKVLTSAEILKTQRQKNDQAEKERCSLQGEWFVSVDNLPYFFNRDEKVRCSLNKRSIECEMENHGHEKIGTCTTGEIDGNGDVIDDAEEMSQDLIDCESDQERASRTCDGSGKRANRSQNRKENQNCIKSNTLIDSSNAIAKSITTHSRGDIDQHEADEGEWKGRKSKSRIGNIGRKHSKLKKRTHSLQRPPWRASLNVSDDKKHKNSLDNNNSNPVEVNRLKKTRRSSLQFIAAPSSMNKRKKQMTLERMFQK